MHYMLNITKERIRGATLSETRTAKTSSNTFCTVDTNTLTHEPCVFIYFSPLRCCASMRTLLSPVIRRTPLRSKLVHCAIPLEYDTAFWNCAWVYRVRPFTCISSLQQRRRAVIQRRWWSVIERANENGAVSIDCIDSWPLDRLLYLSLFFSSSIGIR